MAEYVRRKRPPATHPYWERLRDRAHPPPVGTPVAVMGALGMFLGLYGGIMEPMPYTHAAKTAATVAVAAAVVVFILSVPVLLLDASRQMSRPERFPMALLSGLAVAAILFVALLIALLPVFLSYAACSGRGPWLGMLTGLGIGAIPGAAFGGINRWFWRQRQRQWPRWERMRAPRSRDRAVTLRVVPLPVEPPPAAEPKPEPPEGRPALG
jgi:hypothetical protein